MGFIIGAFKIIFVLGFLILIHEGGHFFVAKACKVKVREFSIGFGPKIFVKQGKETKYTLRIIPFGGFVDMLGEAERRDEKGSFSSSPVWKRILIVIAGATVNIVFGFIAYFSLISIDFNEISTTISNLIPEYNQNLEELQVGDIIKSINGKEIHLKSDIDSYLEKINNENLILKVKRNEELKEINVKATKIVTKYIGIYFSASDNMSSEIAYIAPESPAEKYGLKTGDKILNVNGIEVNDAKKIGDIITTDEVEFLILRNNEEKQIKVIPENVESYIMGVIFEKADSSFKNRIYYGYYETIDYLKSIINNIISLFKGKTQVNQMMGPIGISEVIVKSEGVSQLVYFLSIISLSLGVSNLLPIPALDGGKLFLLIIEAIRRKPLKEETEITIQMLGFSFIILLSLYISFNDILRIF